jgi:ribosomal protein S4
MKIKAMDFLIQSGSCISRPEARRLIYQGGLKVNGKRITIEEGEPVNDLEMSVESGDRIDVGRKTWDFIDGCFTQRKD